MLMVMLMANDLTWQAVYGILLIDRKRRTPTNGNGFKML